MMRDELLDDRNLPARPRAIELDDDVRLTDLLREVEDLLGLS
jgi:hypothetical protein